ncbi:methyltransferase [Bailinhaonella thermotolerans]|uniref:Methyltransferase n=1 Tax=Bailinhaonella thermotolerans TaxID=1070861 RepID=A0A3A4B6P9_9ACTN|nr:methyltransferase [Bailinhaonella thermotolerans]RJL27232.1 methyltransferase [Bailinhaonella thermotolerans]
MGPLWRAADLVTPMAIRVAATLRVADHIAAGAVSDDDLAKRTGADPDALRRVMSHLVSAGVFTRSPGGAYGLGELGEELRGPARDWLDIEGAVGRADLSFVRLLDSVRTGGPAYPLLYGAGYWEDLDRDPGLSESFDRLMGDHPAVGDVIAGHDWTAVRRVADVGGGNGVLLARLLGAHPHLAGMLVERPGPAEAAVTVLEPVRDRAEIHPGDFFGPLPRGADVYLLSRVIGDWDDERATAVLRRCAEAARDAGESGRVLVLEEGDLTGPHDGEGSEMDLRMLVYCAGRDRGLDDVLRLASAAGLDAGPVRVGRCSTLVTLIPRPGRP